MALPSLDGNSNQVKTGAGIIIAAPVGTAVPTLTVSNSKFTNSFPGWHYLGYTNEGATITIGRETEDIEVAEEFFPIKTVTTRVTGSLSADLVNLNQFNIKAAFNGGNWSESGTGTSKIATYTPADPGEEVRLMIAHISEDQDEIFIAYKTFQTAEVSISRKKGSEKASLSGVTFSFEKPAVSVNSGKHYSYHFAGTWGDDYATIA